MKLVRFEVRNFKGIVQASLQWDEILVLIGDNNCGKSSVLQALALFLTGSGVRDELLFRNKCTDEPNAIELVGTFTQLTEKEKENKAVQSRMDGDKWILKKKYWCIADDGGEESWKEMYYSFSPTESFADWPEVEGSWGNFPAAYQPLINALPNKGVRPNVASRDALKKAVKEQKPELIELTASDWIPNPGGGGNWKSNANSILPRHIWIKAVHEATDSLDSKDTTAYGQLLSLIIEKKLMQRPELIDLKAKLESTLSLIGLDDGDPSKQAPEIRDVQNQINNRLQAVIGGLVSIHTDPLQIPDFILPTTYLLVRDNKDAIPTRAEHHGHGLQRTLIMALLQVLEDEQGADVQGEGEEPPQARPVILAIDEPELYMHPQMERKMRDTLYSLASSKRFQIICTTHSPIFLDVGERHTSIVRILKDEHRNVTASQVTQDLFDANDPAEDRERLKVLSNFNPTINESFFAKRVVLLEEESAEWAIRRAAELTGLFARHPSVRRDVTLIITEGTDNIPAFLKVLNHFGVKYLVVHDEDQGNATAPARNLRIFNLITAPNRLKLVSPTCIEDTLGYVVTKGDKPYKAMKRVEQLHAQGPLPAPFMEIVNEVYFGHSAEPAPAAAAAAAAAPVGVAVP